MFFWSQFLVRFRFLLFCLHCHTTKSCIACTMPRCTNMFVASWSITCINSWDLVMPGRVRKSGCDSLRPVVASLSEFKGTKSTKYEWHYTVLIFFGHYTVPLAFSPLVHQSKKQSCMQKFLSKDGHKNERLSGALSLFRHDHVILYPPTLLALQYTVNHCPLCQRKRRQSRSAGVSWETIASNTYFEHLQ